MGISHCFWCIPCPPPRQDTEARLSSLLPWTLPLDWGGFPGEWQSVHLLHKRLAGLNIHKWTLINRKSYA